MLVLELGLNISAGDKDVYIISLLRVAETIGVDKNAWVKCDLWMWPKTESKSYKNGMVRDKLTTSGKNSKNFQDMGG